MVRAGETTVAQPQEEEAAPKTGVQAVQMPHHSNISPKKLGWRETDQRPAEQQRPRFAGSARKRSFWRSATTCTPKPTAHMATPAQSRASSGGCEGSELTNMTLHDKRGRQWGLAPQPPTYVPHALTATTLPTPISLRKRWWQ